MNSDQTERLDSVLRSLGLTGPFDQDEYCLAMEKRFGRKADRFMQVVDDLFEDVEGASAATWRRVYNLKNADKEMSVYISAHQCSSLYKSFLTWMLENVDDSPKDILELGCENGLLTLAVGNLYPNSSVLGVDIVGKAISTAKHLRRKHQVNNTEFRMTNLTKPIDPPSYNADLILAPWVMHDLLPCIVDGGPVTQVERSFLENLGRMCRIGGSLVSVNRFPYSERQVPILIDFLADAGFEPTAQETIAAEEGDQVSRFPLVCFEKVS